MALSSLITTATESQAHLSPSSAQALPLLPKSKWHHLCNWFFRDVPFRLTGATQSLASAFLIFQVWHRELRGLYSSPGHAGGTRETSIGNHEPREPRGLRTSSSGSWQRCHKAHALYQIGLHPAYSVRPMCLVYRAAGSSAHGGRGGVLSEGEEELLKLECF